MDNELKGEGNSINYKFRMHDPRVGRFFTTDPLEMQYPFYSPYQFSGNRVIDRVEREGLEPRKPLRLVNSLAWYQFEGATWNFFAIDNGKLTKVYSTKGIEWEMDYIWGKGTRVYPHLVSKSWVEYNGEVYDATDLDGTFTVDQLVEQQTLSEVLSKLTELQASLNKISERAAAVSVVEVADGIKNIYKGWKAIKAARAVKAAAKEVTHKSVVDKLKRYLLNLDHPVGGSKAKWFQKALGFTKSNMDDFAKQIVFDSNKAIKTGANKQGTLFKQLINIKGANGRKIKVQFNFIKHHNGDVKLIGTIPTKK